MELFYSNQVLFHLKHHFKIIQINYYIKMNNYKFLPRQPHHSPTQMIRTFRKSFNIHQISNNFVPFVQERDSVGRLIRKKQQEPPNSPTITLKKQISQQLLSTQLSQSPQKTISVKAHQVQENINRDFQYRIAHQIRIGERNKVPIRKNSLQMHVRKSSEEILHLPSIRESEQYCVEQVIFRKGSEAIGKTQPNSPLLQKSCSLAPSKTFRKMSLNKLQDYQNISRIRQGENHQKVTNKVSLQRIDEKVPKLRIMVSQSYVTDKIKNKQINELNRYSTFKTLDVKLADRLQQGHNIFLQKMRQTKKLAFQIKMNLQDT